MAYNIISFLPFIYNNINKNAIKILEKYLNDLQKIIDTKWKEKDLNILTSTVNLVNYCYNDFVYVDIPVFADIIVCSFDTKNIMFSLI